MKKMNMMKRAACVALILAALTTGFTACKKEGQKTQTQSPSPSVSEKKSSKTSQSGVRITSLKLNKGSISLTVGSNEKLTYTVVPEDATEPKLLWKSENPEIASVENGNVSALKAGETTIRLYSADERFSVSCRVTVTEKAPDKIDVTGLKLDKSFCVLKTGEKIAVKSTVEPATATDKALTYSIADKTVAGVSEAGELSALKAGLTVMTVKCGNITANCTVLVLDAEGKLPSAAKKELKLKEQDTLTFAEDQPLYKNAGTLTFQSLDTKVMTAVNGKLTAVKAGTTTVRVLSGNTAVFEYTVTVSADTSKNVKVTGVKLDKNEIEVKAGSSVKLTASLLPANATEKTVWWISNDKNIATVDTQGNIKGIKAGECYVTACTKDGEKTAVCKVYVIEADSDPVLVPVTGIKVKNKNVTLKVGESFSLEYNILPENATNKKVYFVSENKTVLAVDKNGLVTALKAGKGVITVGTSPTNFTAVCFVTVTE